MKMTIYVDNIYYFALLLLLEGYFIFFLDIPLPDHVAYTLKLFSLLSSFILIFRHSFMHYPNFRKFLGHLLLRHFKFARTNKLRDVSNIIAPFACKCALELGIFDFIAARKYASLDDIVIDVKSDKRAMEIFLNALVSMGFLEKAPHDTYALSKLSEEYFVSTSPSYTATSLFLLTDPNMVRHLLDMKNALLRGGSQLETDADTAEHPYWSTFAQQTAKENKPQAEPLARLVKSRLEDQLNGGDIHCIDVACGSGSYGYEILKQIPNSVVSFFDFQSVLQETKKMNQYFGMDGNRCMYIAGDLMKGLPNDLYDVIVYSHILHNYSFQDCMYILSMGYQKLKNGGIIVINEFMCEDGIPSIYEDSQPRRFSLMMLCWTKGGQAYSFAQYRKMLENTGLSNVQITKNSPIPNSYAIGRKTEESPLK